MRRKRQPETSGGALTDRIHRACARLDALAAAWARCYPMLWDSDGPPPEVLVTTSSNGSDLPVNPDSPPQLHRAYTAACKHVIRASRKLVDVTGCDPWPSTLLDTAHPVPPHHDLARAGTLNVRETLARIEPDALTARDAQTVEQACNEADAAVGELTRLARELVYPKRREARLQEPHRCEVPSCHRARDGRNKKCRTCQRHDVPAT